MNINTYPQFIQIMFWIGLVTSTIILTGIWCTIADSIEGKINNRRRKLYNDKIAS